MRRIIHLTYLLVLLVFDTPVAVQGQTGEDDATPDEIAASWSKAGSTNDFRLWAQENRERIRHNAVAELARAGLREKNREKLQMAKLLAAEIAADSTMAYVLVMSGDYYSLDAGAYDSSRMCYDAALQLYSKLGDSKNKGHVYLGLASLMWLSRSDDAKSSTKIESCLRTALECFVRAGYDKGLGLAHGRLGTFLKHAGRIDEAETEYRKALKFFEASGDTSSLWLLRQRLGELLLDAGRTAEAELEYRKAREHYERTGNNEGLGKAHEGLGTLLLIAGRVAEAETEYRKALECFERTASVAGRGRVCNRLGELMYITGRSTQAETEYRKALHHYELIGDPEGQGHAYNGLGDLLLSANRYTEAEAEYRRALKYAELAGSAAAQGGARMGLGRILYMTFRNEEAEAEYSGALDFFKMAGNTYGEGFVYVCMGDVYSMTGRYVEAEFEYRRAMDCFERAKHPLGRGNASRGLADLFYKSGRIAEAESEFRKAMEYFRRAGDMTGQGNASMRLGDIMFITGRSSEAEAEYRKAAQHFRQIWNTLGQGNVFRGLGDVMAATGRVTDAETEYRKAFMFLKRAGDLLGQGNVSARLGEILSGSGRYAEADAEYRRALEFFESAGEPIGQGNAHNHLADILTLTGRYEEADISHRKAMAIFTETGERLGQMRAQLGLARIALRLGAPSDAGRAYSLALSLTDSLRGDMGHGGWKKSFQEIMHHAYVEAASFFFSHSDVERGFDAVEKMRARAFLDALAERSAGVDRGMNPALRARRDELAAALSGVARLMEQARTKEERASLASEDRRLRSELNGVIEDIRRDNPAYAQVVYPKTPSLTDIRGATIARREVLIEYLVTDTAAWAMTIRNEGCRIRRLPLNAQKIHDLRDICIGIWKNPGAAGFKDDPSYGALIAPLADDLRDGDTLIIIPDGDLSLLPFEAMVAAYDQSTGKRTYLGERFTIRYMQSAALLAFERSRSGERVRGKGFIGFGDPIYADAVRPAVSDAGAGSRGGDTDTIPDAVLDVRGRGGRSYGRLIWSGREVLSVDSLFRLRGLPSISHLREEATEDRVKSASIRDYGYLLLSCHGLFANEHQGLILTMNPAGGEDGLLNIEEIMGLEWNAAVAVLSACRTGEGKIRRGEGMEGLTRAVMYAGSDAVVGSLWSVDDEGTKELMVCFFDKLLDGRLSTGEALRQAKLEMLRGGRFAHPYYWAAFVLYGE